jgi:hypothetical protein
MPDCADSSWRTSMRTKPHRVMGSFASSFDIGLPTAVRAECPLPGMQPTRKFGPSRMLAEGLRGAWGWPIADP